MSRKASSIPLSRILTRLAVLVAPPVILTSCPGCNDEDEEPEQAGYVATASTNKVYVIDGGPPAIVGLKVECRGDDLPPDCATHAPMWQASALSSNLRVAIANPASPATQASITYERSGDESSSLFTGEASMVTFTTTSVPAELTSTGPVTVGVTALPLNEPVIEEGSALDPGVAVSHPQVTFHGPGNVTITFTYDGPEDTTATVTTGGDPEITISGGASGPVRPGQTITFQVGFNPDEDETKTATITVATANGATGKAVITGEFF